MFVLCLYLLSYAETIELKDDRFPVFYVTWSHVQFDGSILLGSEKELWHLDSSGKVINRLGGNGDEPGEFQLVYYFLWTGEKYLVLDGRRMDVTQFDSKGTFLSRNPLAAYGFKMLGDKPIAASYQPFIKNDRTIKPLYELNIDSKKGVTFKDEGFHFIREEMFDFNKNFKKFFMTTKAGKIYIMDELRPEIHVYDMTYKKLRSFEVEVQGYIMPEKSWPLDTPRKQNQRNMYALSWFRILEKVSGGFFVSLWMPDPQDPDENRTISRLLDESGKQKEMGFEVIGDAIGVHKDTVYSMTETDENVYYLHKHKITGN